MPNALQIADPNADNPLAQAPSWADAAQSVAGTVSSGVDALGQWLAAQRAKSAKMGLWDDRTGLPTGKGLVSAAQQTGNALLMGTTAPGIRAFHGSPYDFERFDTSKIGTGEGAQAYGHGLYFAEGEGTARSYRDKLALQGDSRFIDTPQGRVTQDADIEDLTPHQRALLLTANSGGDPALALHTAQSFAQNPYSGHLWPDVVDQLHKSPDTYSGTLWQMPGRMYEVNIGADPEQFLHWDKPLSEQSPQVQQALENTGQMDAARKYFQVNARRFPDGPTGEDLHEYLRLAQGGVSDRAPAEIMQQAGIPGIRYLDQGSRGAGEGTHNYVVFDANTIDILRKYGLAGLGIGLSGAAAGTQGQPQQ